MKGGKPSLENGCGVLGRFNDTNVWSSEQGAFEIKSTLKTNTCSQMLESFIPYSVPSCSSTLSPAAPTQQQFQQLPSSLCFFGEATSKKIFRHADRTCDANFGSFD